MQVLLLPLTVLLELGKTILLFPAFWYTQGAWSRARAIGTELRDCRKLFHLNILFRHLFTPLYGYTDWETRFVSVIARSGHFVVMTTITVALIIVLIGEFIAYLLLPVFLAYNVSYQIGLTGFDLYESLWNILLNV